MLETWFFARSSNNAADVVNGGFIFTPKPMMVCNVNILSATDVATITSVLMLAFIASVTITMSGVSGLPVRCVCQLLRPRELFADRCMQRAARQRGAGIIRGSLHAKGLSSKGRGNFSQIIACKGQLKM
jgi:hypothetical protein